jgi:triacylglycerol lipase
MSVRLRTTCMVALCTMLSSTALVLGTGIAAACSGTGGGGCTAPTVSTGSATAITGNSATLNGSVNPQGCENTTYTFEYGPSSGGYPNSIGSFAGKGTSPEPVSTHSPLGLQPSTSYHFRLSATNSGGTTTGGSSSFTTTGGTEACLKPTVTTDIPAGVTESSAILGGIVDPHGCSATYWFEWGPSSLPNSYPNKTVPHPAGTVSSYQVDELKDLLPGRGYHVRLSANNAIGTTPGADQPFTTKTTTKDPILFVHGWESDESTWNDMKGWFHDSGWPSAWLRTFSYDTNKSNETTAQLVSSQVNDLLIKTGVQKVDIIAHSMGSLSSRYYIKFLGGTSKVEDWVSLAGPNHGTETIAFCIYAGCEDMVPNSLFLQKLNAGDETPGTVRYATWRSWCDAVVEPPSSVMLNGAVNTEASCLFHTYIHRNKTVFEEVRNFVK